MAISKNARVAKTDNNIKKGVEIFYGTKKEWAKEELPYPEFTLDKVFGTGFNEPVVVCEDEKGEYLTGKSFIGSNVLDPYRMYRRKTKAEVVNQ